MCGDSRYTTPFELDYAERNLTVSHERDLMRRGLILIVITRSYAPYGWIKRGGEIKTRPTEVLAAAGRCEQRIVRIVILVSVIAKLREHGYTGEVIDIL